MSNVRNVHSILEFSNHLLILQSLKRQHRCPVPNRQGMRMGGEVLARASACWSNLSLSQVVVLVLNNPFSRSLKAHKRMPKTLMWKQHDAGCCTMSVFSVQRWASTWDMRYQVHIFQKWPRSNAIPTTFEKSAQHIPCYSNRRQELVLEGTSVLLICQLRHHLEFFGVCSK